MINVHTREEMLQTGVYLITNLVNRKIYVGSAVRSFKVRFGCHLRSLRGKQRRRGGSYIENTHLQNAWNKYGEFGRDGEENFRFDIIEKCCKLSCLDQEDYWTKKYRRTMGREMIYNIRSHAHNNKGFKHSGGNVQLRTAILLR